jgi:hypothetical protein
MPWPRHRLLCRYAGAHVFCCFVWKKISKQNLSGRHKKENGFSTLLFEAWKTFVPFRSDKLVPSRFLSGVDLRFDLTSSTTIWSCACSTVQLKPIVSCCSGKTAGRNAINSIKICPGGVAQWHWIRTKNWRPKFDSRLGKRFVSKTYQCYMLCINTMFLLRNKVCFLLSRVRIPTGCKVV